MVRSLSLSWLIALACLAGGAAAQSSAAPVPAADALNPQAAVPPLRHASAFAGYRRHAETAPIAWKEANDTVARIGGWRAYAREAQPPAAAASKAKP